MYLVESRPQKFKACCSCCVNWLVLTGDPSAKQNKGPGVAALAEKSVYDICRLETADCRLQTADRRLQTVDRRPQTADCRLHEAARL